MIIRFLIAILLIGISKVSFGQLKDTIYFEKRDYLSSSKSEIIFIPPTDTSYFIVNFLNIQSPIVKLRKDWIALKDCKSISSFIKRNREKIQNSKIVLLANGSTKYNDYKCVIDAFKYNDILSFYFGKLK